MTLSAAQIPKWSPLSLEQNARGLTWEQLLWWVGWAVLGHLSLKKPRFHRGDMMVSTLAAEAPHRGMAGWTDPPEAVLVADSGAGPPPYCSSGAYNFQSNWFIASYIHKSTSLMYHNLFWEQRWLNGSQRWARFWKKVSIEAIPILYYLGKVSVKWLYHFKSRKCFYA
jgi:hypothetical protein